MIVMSVIDCLNDQQYRKFLLSGVCMDDIEVTSSDGTKRRYTGSVDRDTRIISTSDGRTVYPGSDSTIEAKPSPIPFFVIMGVIMLLAAWCGG
jgi:hypothetical protein